MSRGKASFETMDVVNTQLADDYNRPNYSKKSDVILDLDAAANKNKGPETRKGKDPVDLDPVSKINKGFSDCDYSLERKGIIQDVEKLAATGRRGLRAGKKIENLLSEGSIQDASKISKYKNAREKVREINLDAGDKLSRISRNASENVRPILADAEIRGQSSVKRPVYKGILSSGIKNLVKDPNKLKEAGKTAVAAGTLGYGTLKATPGTTAGVIDTKAFKLEQLKTPALALGGGIVGGDIANRLQDSHAKRSKEGMVAEIVERLKKE